MLLSTIKIRQKNQNIKYIMATNNNQHSTQKQLAKSVPINSDSENDSDKTRDSMFQVSSQSIFKFIQSFMEKFGSFCGKATIRLIKICDGTFTSDKIARLTSAWIKLVKNFELIAMVSKFDKLTTQITQLRRLLRINRVLILMKDFISYIHKTKKNRRDIFEIFFKSVMLFCDINDILLYLMQLKIIQERGINTLKKNIANFYFFQCCLWVIQQIYDLYIKNNQTKEQLRTRKINILKYSMDTMISHNDFSGKLFSIEQKNSCVLGLISSLIGFVLICK